MTSPLRMVPAKRMDRQFRQLSCPFQTHSTFRGKYGQVHYRTEGPSDSKEVLICLHGINGSLTLFEGMSSLLSSRGSLRVVCYDMYGHGLSNCPRVSYLPCHGEGTRARYDLGTYVEQLREVIQHLELAPGVRLSVLGFSLGGAVAVGFVHRYPGLVSRLMLLSPAGFVNSNSIPGLAPIRCAPLCCLVACVPKCVFPCMFKKKAFLAGALDSCKKEQPMATKEELRVVECQAVLMWERVVWQLFVKRGTLSGLMATLKRFPLFNMSKTYEEGGVLNPSLPVFIAWGTEDQVNPIFNMDRVKSSFPNSECLCVPGAGHVLPCDAPLLVTEGLLAFLRRPLDSGLSPAQITMQQS